MEIGEENQVNHVLADDVFLFCNLRFLPIGARQNSFGACRTSFRERRQLLRALDENEVCIPCLNSFA